MLLRTQSSPHDLQASRVETIMQQVLIALVPGATVMFLYFGWGVIINLLIAIVVAMASEALMLYLRKRPFEPFLYDRSAIVTAALLALALPPLVPWWLVTIAAAFAIIVAKHLYGGLGYNPFNPAMVGYVVVMISFPKEMTLWLEPSYLGEFSIDFVNSLRLVFMDSLVDQSKLDSLTMATPIDTLKIQLAQEIDIESTRNHPVYSQLFSQISGRGWDWINIAFLAGGIWMVRIKIIDWRIPVAFLVGLVAISNLFAVIDYSSYSSPLFHCLSGGAMLCAFFIATDPITASTTPRGRWLYGIGIGVLVYIIRTWGGYPDGIAFAVLLMNMSAPLIDYYTQPKVFGKQENGQ